MYVRVLVRVYPHARARARMLLSLMFFFFFRCGDRVRGFARTRRQAMLSALGVKVGYNEAPERDHIQPRFLLLAVFQDEFAIVP